MIATDPLSLLFIGCFLFGLLFLLITSFMGNLGHGHSIGHDIGHGMTHGVGHAHVPHAHVAHGVIHGHAGTTGAHGAKGASPTAQAQAGPAALLGYINPFSLVLFLLGFGFFGYIFHTVGGLALPFTLILAGVSGFIIAGLLLAMLSRVFGDSEGATVQDVTDRTGLLGKVSVTIKEDNLGEILYISPGGMRKSVPARSVDGRRLERDQEVVVVNYQKGVAEVDTWDHFINQKEVEAIAAPAADELAKLRTLLEESNNTETEYVMRKDLTKE